MIKLLRVDHRLLHGQVAFSWNGYLNTNAILIANDDAVTNDLTKMTLKLAKPANCKLIIKSIEDSITALNEGKADKYDLFIVVNNINDAYKLAKNVDRIKTINIGGLKATKDTHQFSGDKNINLTDNDEKLLRELEQIGKTVEFRMVPSDHVKTL